MEIQKIQEYIADPIKMGKDDFEKIKELIKKYPFFHTAHLLYIKAAHNIEHEDYKTEINRVSASIPNREILHELILKKEIKVFSKTIDKQEKPKESGTRKDIRERIKKRREKRKSIKDDTSGLSANGKLKHESIINDFFLPIIEQIKKHPEEYAVTFDSNIKIIEKISDTSKNDERERKKLERKKRLEAKRIQREKEIATEGGNVDLREKRKLEREKRKLEREKRMSEKLAVSDKNTIGQEPNKQNEKPESKKTFEEKLSERELKEKGQSPEEAKLEREKEKLERRKLREKKLAERELKEKEQSPEEAKLEREKRKEERRKLREEKNANKNKEEREQIKIETEVPEEKIIKKETIKKQNIEEKIGETETKKEDPYTKVIIIGESKDKENISKIKEKEEHIAKQIKEKRKAERIKEKKLRETKQDTVVENEKTKIENKNEVEDIFNAIISSKKSKTPIKKTHIEITGERPAVTENKKTEAITEKKINVEENQKEKPEALTNSKKETKPIIEKGKKSIIDKLKKDKPDTDSSDNDRIEIIIETKEKKETITKKNVSEEKTIIKETKKTIPEKPIGDEIEFITEDSVSKVINVKKVDKPKIKEEKTIQKPEKEEFELIEKEKTILKEKTKSTESKAASSIFDKIASFKNKKTKTIKNDEKISVPEKEEKVSESKSVKKETVNIEKETIKETKNTSKKEISKPKVKKETKEDKKQETLENAEKTTDKKSESDENMDFGSVLSRISNKDNVSKIKESKIVPKKVVYKTEAKTEIAAKKIVKKAESIKEDEIIGDIDIDNLFAKISNVPKKKEPEIIDKKDELIQNFVENEPTMKRIEKKEEENIDISKESIKEKKPVITELMASIYINQSKYDQAIEIYNKLILKNPEKKDYFANKIKETEKLK